ncbi:MAG TPA: glycosyltransferase family 4 protein [Gaiellaceae bacterium]|nr:glycosyltransferase family 4 protein [Gaiellaceae bacterium]
MIRVLRAIARLNMGGPALHVSYLADGLRGRGYETILVAGSVSQGEQSMAYVAEELGVPVVTIPHLHREISPVRDLLATVRLARIMRAERPAILHTHTAKAGAVGRVAALLAGRSRPPIIVHTFHGHVLRGYFGRFWTGVFRLLERLLARITDALVAVSPEVRDELVAFGVAPASKFRVIRLGIELDQRVARDDQARRRTRRVMGVRDGRFVVGWIGRMTAVKRTDVVLESFRRLREQGVDAVLCMVGDGPDRRSVEDLAAELGVMRDCLFPGYQEDVGPFFAAFDVFVLPSGNEGTPVTAIEALASGCPVVATRVGGVPDVVSDGEDGFLVEPAAVDELAARLAELARDPGLRARMGDAGRERMQTRYAVARLVDDIDRLYRDLLERKGIDPGALAPDHASSAAGAGRR